MADSKYTDWSTLYDRFNSSFDASRFKSQQYKRTDGTIRGVYYTDGSDAYANLNQMWVSFQHVPSGQSVFLKAFVTAFNESYSSDWAEEKVYGRSDPIYLFKNTTRKISMGLKLPAATEGEAYDNLSRISALAQFLYPLYSEVQNANTISQSPMIRIKVMNLLSNDAGKRGDYHGTVAAPMNQFDAYTSDGSDSSNGVLGAITSLIVNHNLEGDAGVFHKLKTTDEKVHQNVVFPKLIDINLEFSPVHETPLGWQIGKGKDGKFTTFSAPGFPYGTPPDIGDVLSRKEKDAASAIAAIEKEGEQSLKDQAKARYGNWLMRGLRKNNDESLYQDIEDGEYTQIAGTSAWQNKKGEQVTAGKARRLAEAQALVGGGYSANDPWGYSGDKAAAGYEPEGWFGSWGGGD